MTLTYHTRSTPSPDDPEGMRPPELGGDGVSATLPARYVSGSDGHLVIEVLTVLGDWSRHEGVSEGSEPGQVETSTGIARSVGGGLRTRVAALRNDEDPAVRLSVAAIAAIHRLQPPGQAAHDLLGLAEDPKRPAWQRTAALLWLERLLPKPQE